MLDEVWVGRVHCEFQDPPPDPRRTHLRAFYRHHSANLLGVVEFLRQDRQVLARPDAEGIGEEMATIRAREPAHLGAKARIEKGVNGRVDDPHTPLPMSEEPPSSVGELGSRGAREKAQHLAVLRRAEDWRCRAGGLRGNVLSAVREEIPADLGRKIRTGDEDSLPRAWVRLGHGLDVALLQDYPAVECIGEPLQRDPGNRVALGDLPEGAGHPPIPIQITVVKGPDAVPRRGQDVAANDVEGEAEDEIQIVGADRGDVLGREVLGVLTAEFRSAADYRQAAVQLGREVHPPLGGDLAGDERPLVEVPE